jgi:hypothetical protein
MPTLYPDLRRESLRERSRALERFAEWQARARPNLSAEVSLSGVALLFELLPASSRTRAVDPSGVAAMHRALSVLGARER